MIVEPKLLEAVKTALLVLLLTAEVMPLVCVLVFALMTAAKLLVAVVTVVLVLLLIAV